MRASDLVKLLQERIDEFGDQDIGVIEQTGADSYIVVPVSDVTFSTMDENNSCMVVE